MKRKLIFALSAVLAVSFIAAAVLLRPSTGYAAMGREARSRYEAYSQRMMRLSEEEIEADDELVDEKGQEDVFWFRIPDGYLDTKTDEKKYVSKINPYDTPEVWRAFDSVVDMRAASQVPADIIKTVSTDELVLYCMNYNLDADFFAYNTPVMALNRMREDFNGLDELFNRSDAPASLIKLYKLCDFSDPSRRSNLLLRLPYIEAMLSYEDVLSKLTVEQSNELAAVCAERIVQALNDESGSRSMGAAVRLAVLCQYRTDKDFAALIDSCEGTAAYISEGFLFPDAIDNETLGRIVAHFSELLSEYNGGEE